MKKLNLNSRIKVRLTPHGADIYYHQFDELIKVREERGIPPFQRKMPRVDKDGFTEMQLWYFMELFGGENVGMGKKNVIEPIDIFISEEDLEDM